MAPRRRDEDGIVGVILTVVIVFALIAVVMLTRTVIAAQEINNRVVAITGSVSGANQHLNTGCDTKAVNGCSTTALPALETTKMLTSQIDAAAKPLTGQAAQILTSVNSINQTVAGPGGIQATATAINGTVHSIDASATSINASVHSIGNTFNNLNPVVTSIASGVAAINGRVDVIMGSVNGIKADTTVIVAKVGTPGSGGNTIWGQAHLIECNVLVKGPSCA
ncbi:MAG: hypothetical protein M3N98_15610 [Actinomycetota bacterium]|nr:hypothetical protein [Actinomycetota bacterium]